MTVINKAVFNGSVGAAIVVSVLLSFIACTSSEHKEPDALSGTSPAPSVGSIVDIVPTAGDAGRVLVVYFSQGDATKRVASDIAELTGADIEQIEEEKDRGTGFFGFMKAGMDSSFGRASAIRTPTLDPAEYDVVFVCTPIWAWKLCPPVRSWLRMFKGSIGKVGFATVSGDTKPDKVVKMMVAEGGVEPFSFVGFAERDFLQENRGAYADKISSLVDSLRLGKD